MTDPRPRRRWHLVAFVVGALLLVGANVPLGLARAADAAVYADAWAAVSAVTTSAGAVLVVIAYLLLDRETRAVRAALDAARARGGTA